MRSVESALQQVKTMLATQFDAALYAPLEKAAREFFNSTTSGDDCVEVELTTKDLTPGMEISRDVRTGTGLLLLRKKTVLNLKNIDTLTRGFHLDPAKSGVFVFMTKIRT
jgi:hypothetical protein